MCVCVCVCIYLYTVFKLRESTPEPCSACCFAFGLLSFELRMLFKELNLVWAENCKNC